MRSGDGWRALELGDVEPQQWPGTDLSWHPLREALGTRIVDRAATAAEPNTTVLALGGPPTFQPSASEWIEKARPHVRTNPAKARKLLDDLKAARPDSIGVDIGEALYALGQGDRALARSLLASVLAQEPSLRGVISRDPDLGPVVGELD